MDPRGPEKKERLLNALNLGMVMVHLDARRPGVVVPQALPTEAHLRLNLSYRFDPPDLSVNEWGVRQSLSFGGSRFAVAIPWSALFAVTSHVTKEFWMFLEDLPPELLHAAAPPATPAQAGPRPSGRPQLRPVAPLAALEGEAAASSPSDNETPVERPRTPVAGLAAARPLAPEPAPEPASAPEVGAAEASGPPDEPPKPKNRNHLRVVK